MPLRFSSFISLRLPLISFLLIFIIYALLRHFRCHDTLRAIISLFFTRCRFHMPFAITRYAAAFADAATPLFRYATFSPARTAIRYADALLMLCLPPMMPISLYDGCLPLLIRHDAFDYCFRVYHAFTTP